MKKILPLFIVLLIFIFGCGKEKTTDLEPITTQMHDVDKIIKEVIGEEVIEEKNITTVRLCHDTDNGIIKWINGTVFGFYDNAKRFEFNDYCFDNNILIEYYCEDKIPKNISFICKSGCLDNHCI